MMFRLMGGIVLTSKGFWGRCLVAAVGLSTSCAVTPPVQPVAQFDYQTATSAQLWNYLAASVSTLQMMSVEAELASRGEMFSGSEYVGRRTAALVGITRYVRVAPTGADRDCSDFSSSAEAQRFFIAAGGPSADPHGLDRDGDGSACEFGQLLRTNAAKYRLTTAPAARLYAPAQTSSQCFTGPRGGTYTITASGNKNYDGC